MEAKLKVLFILLLVGCSPKKSSTELNVRTWSYIDYETCSANINPGIDLPFEIAFTLNRTNLTYGRYDGLTSSRAHVLYKNRTSEELGAHLIPKEKKGQMGIQVGSWFGDNLVLNTFSEDPQHAMYEEAVKSILITQADYLNDTYIYDFNTYKNLTVIERVSNYNSGIQKYLNDSNKVVFSANINGENKLYTMNLDGTNKSPLASNGYIYGYNPSPDGKHIAYHQDYKLYIDGQYIDTPYVFNFAPKWSPDFKGVVFWCGSNNDNSDYCWVNKDGSGLKIIASRNGYIGQVPFIDGYDFHQGGSDVTTWIDTETLIYGAMTNNGAIELFSVNINSGAIRQVTSHDGWTAYPEAYNGYIVYTVLLNGVRNLYITDLNQTMQLTNLDYGCTIKYPKIRVEIND